MLYTVRNPDPKRKAPSDPLPTLDAADISTIHHRARESFFKIFQDLARGALMVDRHARITWIDEKYIEFLGLTADAEVIGRHVAEVIPHTRMPEVLREGRAIPFDVMEANNGWCVVSRFPLFDDAGTVIGGFGFVMFGDLEILQSVSQKIERLRTDLNSTRSKLEALRRSKYNFSQFVGNSGAAAAIKRQARQAASTDSTIMICGETGTGKELLAQAIHAASSRADRHFVGINVAAIPEELMEVELFGAKYGAYTGADRNGRIGKLELAHEGTLFLDEVADMSLRIQVKLLRCLQEREIEPLGSNAVTRVDVRVIAASSRDLSGLVEDGKFRSDLYYRLNVVPLNIPTLRERADDIPLLCEVLIEDICKSQRIPLKEVDREAIELLQIQPWPGNVRELRNVLERACVLSSRQTLSVDDFRDFLVPRQSLESTMPEKSNVVTLGSAVGELERTMIRAAWEQTHGNKLLMAKLLGVSRSNLYKKLELYGIQ
jgi:transcriptional regulator with PAS, ATPase and Fis domain